MSSSRLRLRRASFTLNLPKHDVRKSTARLHGLHEISSPASNLTPDIQAPTSKPLLLDPAAVGANFLRVGNYLISGEVKDTAGSQGSASVRDAVNIITEERLTCKVITLMSYCQGQQYSTDFMPHHRIHLLPRNLLFAVKKMRFCYICI